MAGKELQSRRETAWKVCLDSLCWPQLPGGATSQESGSEVARGTTWAGPAEDADTGEHISPAHMPVGPPPRGRPNTVLSFLAIGRLSSTALPKRKTADIATEVTPHKVPERLATAPSASSARTLLPISPALRAELLQLLQKCVRTSRARAVGVHLILTGHRRLAVVAEPANYYDERCISGRVGSCEPIANGEGSTSRQDA